MVLRTVYWDVDKIIKMFYFKSEGIKIPSHSRIPNLLQLNVLKPWGWLCLWLGFKMCLDGLDALVSGGDVQTVTYMIFYH